MKRRELLGTAVAAGTLSLTGSAPRAMSAEKKKSVAETPVIPLALGAAVALLFNFGASSRFVFAEPRDRKVGPGDSFR